MYRDVDRLLFGIRAGDVSETISFNDLYQRIPCTVKNISKGWKPPHEILKSIDSPTIDRE